MRAFDIKGEQVERLLVLYRDGKINGSIAWLCLCSCGKTARVKAHSLAHGRTRSCGCLRNRKGKETHAWRGGKTLDQKGYIKILLPEHPRADSKGYVRENIAVLEQKLGRPLGLNEIAHHKDENIQNNDPDNLEAMSLGEHSNFHNRGERSSTAKLTESDVYEIRSNRGQKQNLLAVKYNVTPSCINAIIKGKSWKHIL